MQTAMIKASDMRRFGRMDAGFHIARARVADLTAHLEAEHDAEQAAAMLRGLTLDALAPLKPLLRGRERPGMEGYMRAVHEYPHIALALVQSEVHGAIERQAVEMARGEASMARLKALLPKSGE